MPVLSKLIVKLSVDAAEYNKGMGDAETKAGASSAKIKESIGSIQGTITGLSVGINEIVGVFQAVGQTIKDTIDPVVEYGEQVRELKYSIGATATEASMLIQAADDVRVSFDSLNIALQAAIRKGVEPSIEGIARLADQYNSIQGPISKTKFLMDTFGRSGADLAPLMALGAEGIRKLGEEARETGLVLSETTMQQLEDYQKLKDTWGDVSMSYKIEMTKNYLPTLNKVGKDTMDFYGQVKNGLAYWYNNLDATEQNILAFGKLHPFLGKAIAQIERWAAAQREAIGETKALTAEMEKQSKYPSSWIPVPGQPGKYYVNENWARYNQMGYGRASGGDVSAGKIYPVGERGVELFMPEAAGKILNPEQSKSLVRGLGSGDNSAVTDELRKLRELIAAQGRPATSGDVERAVRDGLLKAQALAGG
jgi:hypothetical protein